MQPQTALVTAWERFLYDTVVNTVELLWSAVILLMKQLQLEGISVFIFHLIKTDKMNAPSDRLFMSSADNFLTLTTNVLEG